MSTETPPEQPTGPSTPQDSGTVDPDNWHIDGTQQAAPEGLLAGDSATKPTRPGTVKPDNWHIDGTRA